MKLKHPHSIGLALVCTGALAGCGNSQIYKTYESFPVVPTAFEKPRATRADVIAAAGKPLASYPTKMIKGTCEEYRLNKSGRETNFYVAYNEQGIVVSTGFDTCAQAEASKSIFTSEPLSDRTLPPWMR